MLVFDNIVVKCFFCKDGERVTMRIVNKVVIKCFLCKDGERGTMLIVYSSNCDTLSE